MSGIYDIGAFLFAGIFLNLSPSDITTFILTNPFGQGEYNNLLSALGTVLGSIIHTIFATLESSLIFTKSVFVYDEILYISVTYLFFIGAISSFKRTNFFQFLSIYFLCLGRILGLIRITWWISIIGNSVWCYMKSNVNQNSKFNGSSILGLRFDFVLINRRCTIKTAH